MESLIGTQPGVAPQQRATDTDNKETNGDSNLSNVKLVSNTHVHGKAGSVQKNSLQHPSGLENKLSKTTSTQQTSFDLGLKINKKSGKIIQHPTQGCVTEGACYETEFDCDRTMYGCINGGTDGGRCSY